MKERHCQTMIVLQKEKHFVFDIYISGIKWEAERIIWIGFYNNDENDDTSDTCLISKLSKDVVNHMLNMIRTQYISPNKDRKCIKI